VLIVPQDTRGFFTGESGKEMYAKSPPAPPGRDNTLNFGLSFYRNDLKPGDPKALPVGEVIIVPNPTPAKPTEKNEPPKEAPKDRLPEGGSKPGHFSPVSQPEKGQPPQPADTGLKIIRTGDMEFEVTSYDAAFKNIDKLIAGVKGGFVLRENSKKQENGKKRGTVIVRMPPQFLTKFMDDLKADLEKAGELKTQSIGSQDVTKEFIDTDGELRMLRVQEGRLLDIIKNPKGEVKDLLLAEEKLGITRVRIEKLEGQIRYLSNQVGLSTLTINLVEKEIQAATGMVITEKVQMLVEVDNVAEAKDAVIKAAEDLKGRVVKSEFKQEKAGQLEAIIHAQIPPDKRKAFSEQLEKLGLVSDRESSQSQKAEGGTKAPFELKRRTEDVLFEVTLNNIVGMNPRRAVVMVVATTDVPANYKKLEDAVRAAQGRILEGKLLDPDKQRITGFLRFEVPTDKKAALDKQLAEFGPAVNREEQELKANIRATEQRYGYAVHLRSLATLPARENVTVSIVDVKDVQQKASELAELARKNKGVADKAEVTLTRQGEKRATVILNVPLSSSDALLEEFKKAGKVMEMKQTPNRQVPEHDLATAQITLNLTGGSPIVPSDEGLWPRIRSGLYLSFQVFAWCITVVIIGIAGVLPWVLVIWGGVKLMTWFAKK
jgi:hypothetical protein